MESNINKKEQAKIDFLIEITKNLLEKLEHLGVSDGLPIHKITKLNYAALCFGKAFDKGRKEYENLYLGLQKRFEKWESEKLKKNGV